MPISLTEDEFRLLTWPRPELSRMAIYPKSLRQHCPLDNGLFNLHANDDNSIAFSNIGDLNALPLEIVHLILSTLDLRSLTDFRALSWRARALVDNFPPYNNIVRHSPDVLRALLSTHMAIYFTAQDIFNALCTQQCSICGNFGPFLDLFTSCRSCLTCVMYSDALLCITASSAKEKLGLNSKALRALPTLLSVPGQYTESERTCRERISLVRMVSASAARSTQYPPSVSNQFVRQYDSYGENPYRFMAMIRFPTLDIATGKLDWGVSCQACRLGPPHERRGRGYYDWNTFYTTSGYIEHFQKCQLSQIGRTVAPGYILPTGGDQSASDAKFLEFLSNFKF